MPRTRSIQATEADVWLEVMLAYAFDPRRAQRAARLDLLGVAYDATAYSNDIPAWRLAELLLAWGERHINGEDWQRLQSLVRKRRRVAAVGA